MRDMLAHRRFGEATGRIVIFVSITALGCYIGALNTCKAIYISTKTVRPTSSAFTQLNYEVLEPRLCSWSSSSIAIKRHAHRAPVAGRPRGRSVLRHPSRGGWPAGGGCHRFTGQPDRDRLKRSCPVVRPGISDTASETRSSCCTVHANIT